MLKRAVLALPAIIGLVACAARHDDASYGWDAPITEENVDLPVTQRLGANAPDVIAGHSLKAIVTDSRVRIRGDGKACVACHEWAKDVSREDYCRTRANAFIALPTATGHKDPANAKPKVLQQLMLDWQLRACP